ncbi:MAG: hypothetical protein QW057_10860, partial [Candidatus Bathyarchaeia archaeon]
TLGPMRKLTQRGIALRKRLEAEGFKAIEVYPGGAQDILRIPRKGEGLKGLMEGLVRLGVEGLSEGMSDHELDAVTSALVGMLYLKGEAETLGDRTEGIVMPREAATPQRSEASPSAHRQVGAERAHLPN